MEYIDKKAEKDSNEMPKFCFFVPPRYRKKTIGMRFVCLLVLILIIMVLCLLICMILFWHLGVRTC